MTVTKTNSEDSTSSLDVTKDLSMPPTEMDTSTSSTHESSPLKSKLSPNRCLVCFKLVRNLKGSKLTEYHELNAPIDPEEDKFLSNYESNFSSKLPKDLNGNFIRENFNLVKPAATTETIKKSIKIGDKISNSLKGTCCQQLFNKNSLYLKKICVQCLRQINVLDYHVKNAEKLADSLAGKIKWSSKLIGNSDRCTRALSVGLSASALKENGQQATSQFQSNRSFTKRKINDSQHSSMNILTKLVKTEPSLIKPENASRYHQQVTSKIPNSFHTTTHSQNHTINKKSLAQKKHIMMNGTNETNHKGMNANMSNSQLVPGTVNNFRSINDDHNSGLRNGLTCHNVTSSFKKNLSPSFSLNKNSIVNQHSQYEHKIKNELKLKPSWIKNESDMSESSCKSSQLQQEMGSRRKRKNVNPSRLIKENLSELSSTLTGLIDEKLSNQTSPKKTQIHNGHSTFEKRHHSLDSLTKLNHSVSKSMKPNKNVHKLIKAKICPIKSDLSEDSCIENEIMKSKKDAEFMKMINNKENDKCSFNNQIEQNISKSNNHECDNDNAEYSHENIEGADAESGNYVINESETEDAVSGEMICNENYSIDSHRHEEDTQEVDRINSHINNGIEGDETENEIEIDINEVEHDAGDEYDHETETEDHSSIENDENTFVNMNGNIVTKRENINMINGSLNPNDIKLHKKISNLKKAIFSGSMSGHHMPKQNVSEHRYMQSSKNGGGIRNNNDPVRFVKNIEAHSRNLKKFSAKNENLGRNLNGGFNMNGTAMSYDDSSNYSKLNRVFTSPSQSESPSPSPSQMADTSHLNNYLNTSSTNSNTKHACEVCKKTFKTQNILRQHMRIHTGDKPFVCDICSKAFSQMASLKYHLATHSDARPYSCHVCSKTFKLKPPFKKHIKECQPKLEMIGFDKNSHYLHSSSPSQMNSFNYYNQNQFNINSNGLELETNEDDE